MNAEVIIIGSGVIGLIQAISLANQGLKIIIIERQKLDDLMNNINNIQSLAISYNSALILEEIGLGSFIQNNATPIEQIRISDRNSNWYLHFDNKIINYQPLGYMIKASLLLKGLYQLIKTFRNIQVIDKVKQLIIEDYQNQVKLRLDDQVLIGQLLIGADGKYSKIREHAKLKTISWQYKQNAIICDVEHQFDHQNIAQERFLASGPFAILPLRGGNTSSIVWTETTQMAKLVVQLPEDELLSILKSRFTNYLGDIKIISQVLSQPISGSYAQDYFHHRLVLVGDAAHSIHPIAGQGLNMGIKDVKVLSELIAHQIDLGQDIANHSMLSNYQRSRKTDNMMMMMITDRLNSIFLIDYNIVNKIRRLGLTAINFSVPLKRFIMNYAMGGRKNWLF